MTKPLRKRKVNADGSPDWFSHWLNENPRLDSRRDAISYTDCDGLHHRYKPVDDRLGRRECEHLMMVERKYVGETLSWSQDDTLSVAAAAFRKMFPVTRLPNDLQCVKTRKTRVVAGIKMFWHGIHLLVLPLEPTKVGPVLWDSREITMSRLESILRFDIEPYYPHGDMRERERRHKSPQSHQLLMGTAS